MEQFKFETRPRHMQAGRDRPATRPRRDVGFVVRHARHACGRPAPCGVIERGWSTRWGRPDCLTLSIPVSYALTIAEDTAILIFLAAAVDL